MLISLIKTARHALQQLDVQNLLEAGFISGATYTEVAAVLEVLQLLELVQGSIVSRVPRGASALGKSTCTAFAATEALNQGAIP